MEAGRSLRSAICEMDSRAEESPAAVAESLVEPALEQPEIDPEIFEVFMLEAGEVIGDLDRLFQNIRLFRHRRFEVLLFHVIHPEELALPEGRAFHFYDPEGGAEIEADPQDVAAHYLEAFEAYGRRVRSMAIGCGCEYERIDTTTPYPEAIRAYLRRREALSR